ncbi:MAG: putative toxin-antitoxin system toxin component, PIN family [Patescibacteria group bacterium]
MAAKPQNNPPRVVLDSNILISSYVFGGKPQIIFQLVVEEEIKAITSQILTSEFLDVLRKKFGVRKSQLLEIKEEVDDLFEIVFPTQTLKVVKDNDDNRVLEAAIEGRCEYIVTGDKELLELGEYKGINILTPTEFLERTS